MYVKQLCYTLLTMPFIIMGADNNRCLESLKNNISIKKILTDLAEQELPDLPHPMTTQSAHPHNNYSNDDNDFLLKKTYSDDHAAKHKKSYKKIFLLKNIFKNKGSSESITFVRKQKDPLYNHTNNIEDNKNIILHQLRLNTFLQVTYSTKENPWVKKASECITLLRKHQKENASTLALGNSDSDELLKKTIALENECNTKNYNYYEKLLSQKSHESLRELAFDMIRTINYIYNNTPEKSDGLFDTIDLILMRSAEILMNEPLPQTEAKKTIQELENIIETIEAYRKTKLQILSITTSSSSPLTIEEIREAIKQKKELFKKC